MKRPRTRARAGAAALASLLSAAAPGHALGQPVAGTGAPRRVALDASACAEISEAALRRIVAIEIGDLLVAPGEPPPAEIDRVVIACTGSVARVEADGPGRPQPLDRTLGLDDFPGDAAPRALALAAVEILAALSPDVRQRIEARDQPTPPPRPAAAINRAAGPPAPQPPSTAVFAAAVWRAFLTPHGVSVLGARAGVRRALGARSELAADGELATGAAPATAGTITSTLASAGLMLGLRGGSRRLGGAVAAGGRAGVARLQGQPAPGGAVVGARTTRAWGGPLFAARAASGGQHVGVELAAELGYDLGVANGSADGATAVTVGGPWVQLSAAITVQF